MVNAVEPVVQPVTNTVAPIVESVAPVVQPITEAAGDIVTPVTESLQPVVAPIAEAVTPVVQPIADAVQPVVEPIIDAVQPVTEPVTEIVSPVTDPVGEIVNPVVNPIDDVLPPAVDPIVDPVTPDPIVGGNTNQHPTPGAGVPSMGSPVEVPVLSADRSDELTTPGDPDILAPTSTGIAPDRPLVSTETGSSNTASSPAVTMAGPQAIAARVEIGLSDPVEGQAVFAAPQAPRSPIDGSHSASPGSQPIALTTAGTGNSSSSGSSSGWPSASLPASLLGLLAVGALILLTVTEASPRTWQFRPYTPPA